MQTFGKDYSFNVLCITNFQEKAQNKNKVGIKTTFLLMMTVLKAKSLHKFTVVSGRTKGYFLKSEKQQTNII